MIPQSTKDFITQRVIAKFGHIQCEGEYERHGHGDKARAVRVGDCSDSQCTIFDPAHIVHRKMGGRHGKALSWINEPDNLLLLCRTDHIKFDGGKVGIELEAQK